MSNLVDHANRELDILGYPRPLVPDADVEFDMDTEMRRCLVELVTVFANQHHSGFSSSYCLSLLNKLLRFEPLSPVTNNPEEWVDQSYHPAHNNKLEILFQNIRHSEAFSHDGGKTYYLLSERRKWVKWIYFNLPHPIRRLVWNSRLFERCLYPFHTSVQFNKEGK